MFAKKYLKLFIVLLVFILVIGCSDQSYEEYQNAVEKTENLESGKYTIEIEYQTNYNAEELTVEEFKELSNYSSIKFSGTNVFNQLEDQMHFYGNLESGSLGLDLEYYQQDDKEYIKIPILGKYIDLNDLNMESITEGISFNGNETMEMNFNEEVFEEIGNLWTEAIQTENVFKGEKSFLETPDGDVKVTEYTIDFSDELLKELMKETTVILELSDEVELMDQFTINTFNYTAYVDIDGFIIKEEFLIDYSIMDIVAVDSGYFRFDITNYDINKEQNIEMPEIKDTMILDLNQMDELLEEFKGLDLGEFNE